MKRCIYLLSIPFLLSFRSETLAIPDSDYTTSEGKRSSKRRRLSGGSFRMTPENMSNTSSGFGMDVRIDMESPNTPILERPTTLPEMNSRPASRVMKSFSVDEVISNSLSLLSSLNMVSLSRVTLRDRREKQQQPS